MGNGFSLTAVICTGQFPKFNASSEWLVLYRIFDSFFFFFKCKKMVSSSEWCNYKVRKWAKKKKFNNTLFPYSLLHISGMIWRATEQVKQDCWIRVYLILVRNVVFFSRRVTDQTRIYDFIISLEFSKVKICYKNLFFFSPHQLSINVAKIHFCHIVLWNSLPYMQ